MRDTIDISKSTLIVLDPDGLTLTRLWCLFEVVQTPEARLDVYISSSGSPKDCLDLIEKVNVDEAKMSYDPVTEKMITDEILRAYGSKMSMTMRLRVVLGRRVLAMFLDKIEKQEEQIQQIEQDKLALQVALRDADNEAAPFKLPDIALAPGRVEAIRRALRYAGDNFTPPGNKTSLLNAITVEDLRLALKKVGGNSSFGTKQELANRLLQFVDKL